MAVLIAIGVNLRSDMLGTVPIIAIAMAMAARGPLRSRVMRGAGLGAALAAAALVSLVPYGLIQREAFGEFSFSTPALGVVAWQGISEYPNPWGAVLSDTHVVNLLAAQGLEYATPEGDRYLLDKVKDAVSEDPLWFVGTTIDRAKRVLFMQHNWGFPGAIQDGLDIPRAPGKRTLRVVERPSRRVDHVRGSGGRLHRHSPLPGPDGLGSLDWSNCGSPSLPSKVSIRLAAAGLPALAPGPLQLYPRRAEIYTVRDGPISGTCRCSAGLRLGVPRQNCHGHAFGPASPESGGLGIF